MTRRAEAKAATREKVLAAGKTLFDRDGYHATTIRDIAAQAGMSTGTVFASFNTGKDELYHAIYGHFPISPEAGRALKAERDALAAEVATLKAEIATLKGQGRFVHRPLSGGQSLNPRGVV